MNSYSLNNVASNVVLFPVKPVAWYKFDNNLTLDSSSNTHTLANNGLVINNTIYKTGVSSAACQSNYATVPTTINPSTINAYNGISFTLWFRMSTSSGRDATLIYFADSTKTNHISVSKNGTNNTLKFQINTNSVITDIAYVDNNWHHFVWSIAKDGKWTIYMDGVVTNISTTRSIPTVSNWNNSIIGGAVTICNYDDFRIYNSVMTASEVNFLYNSTNVNNVMSGYGSIGIGKYSCNLYKLDVNGAINAINFLENGKSIQQDWTRNISNLYTNRNVGIGTAVAVNALDIYNGDIYLRNGTIKKTVSGDPSSVIYQFNENPITGTLFDSNTSSTKFNLSIYQNNNIYDSTTDMVAWYFTDPSDITKNKVSDNYKLSSGSFEYPPASLNVTVFTGDSIQLSYLTYGNGAYTLRSSSSYLLSYTLDKCFDKNITTAWYSSNNAYDSTGNYSSTVQTKYNSQQKTYLGEWLEIMLPSTSPYNTILKSYSLSVSSTLSTLKITPKDWILLGSSDGTTWTSIHNTSNNSWSANEEKIFDISTNYIEYSYYRICINKTNGGSIQLVGISEWKLFIVHRINMITQNNENYDIQHLQNDNLSLVFNNTYLNVVNDGAFAPTAFTISFYLNVIFGWNVVPSIQTIVSCMHRDSLGTLRGWEIQLKKTDIETRYELVFVTGNNNNNTNTIVLQNFVISKYNEAASSGWMFIYLSCSSTNNVSSRVYKFYDNTVNNVSEQVSSITYYPHSSSSLRIGMGINYTSGVTDNLVYNGTKLANFRFYNKVLEENKKYQLLSSSLLKQSFDGKNGYVFNGNSFSKDFSSISYSDRFYKQIIRYNPLLDTNIIKYLLNTFHRRGFSVHFIYLTYPSLASINDYQNNVCFIGNATAYNNYTDIIRIYLTKTSQGNFFYFKVANNNINTIIDTNKKYTIDLTCSISESTMMLSIYLNGNLSTQQKFTNYNNELLNANITNLYYLLGSHPVEENITYGSIYLSTFKLQDYRMYPYVLSASAIQSLNADSTAFTFDEEYQLQRWIDSANYESSTSKYIYYNQGNVGIGTYDAGSYRLSVSSNLFITGEILATAKISAYNDVSDDRIKTIVDHIDNALEVVNTFSVFRYKTDNELAQSYGFDPERINIGLSAQQVQRSVPEVVTLAPFDISTENKSISGNNYIAIKYKQLIPLLFAALKELINKYDLIMEKYNELYRIKDANIK